MLMVCVFPVSQCVWGTLPAGAPTSSYHPTATARVPGSRPAANHAPSSETTTLQVDGACVALGAAAHIN